MPAVHVDDVLVLPRVAKLAADPATARPVERIVNSRRQLEGAGFEIWRPFPGNVAMSRTDPFLLLDQLGPTINGPGEAAGAPWHPHRGFETVTYIIDGEVAHHDTHGGGGVIGEGDTQWMTAGAGLLHDELPTERAFREGGPSHGVQLWVNLPAALKFTQPRYQAITADSLQLLSSHDGGALLRLIAGDVAGYSGPGATHTPITYVHATIEADAQLVLPWNPGFSAMAYVLTGSGTVGVEERPVQAHQLVMFGPGQNLVLRGGHTPHEGYERFDVLLLGGMPIGEPISHYGPFVMNTDAEIEQAILDFQQGRLGVIPPDQMAPRRFA